MAQIKISDICPIAMTEEQGLLVRDAMQPAVVANEAVVLDFTGISLFATMFFNASIGHYVVERGVDYCTNNISLINISDLGRETYRHSFLNAKEIAESKNKELTDTCTIVKKNIEEI